MATPLVPGTPQTTTDSTFSADLSQDQLAPGSILHFSLVVEDDLGNSSQPALLDVIIQALPIASLEGTPTVISIANPNINLVGKTSSPAANLKQFTWELVSVTPPTGGQPT
jgi:hypothetical protein